MGLLLIGLILFLGIHLVPVFPAARERLLARLGEKLYKGWFSLLAAAGLVLIVLGFAHAPAAPRLFAPVPVAIMLAPLVVMVAFVLLASANMKTHIRAKLRHPMLIGVILWSAVHLLANGEVRTTLLFGAFLAWAVLDLISAIGRHAVKKFTPVVRQDVIAVVSGVVLTWLVMSFHRQLFGVKVVPWGF